MLKNLFLKMFKKYGIKFVLRFAIDFLNDYLVELEQADSMNTVDVEHRDLTNQAKHY